MKTLLLITTIVLTGCSDADRSHWSARGTSHHIALYSGGKIVAEWNSTGMIENEGHSDGYYFMDAETKSLVRVSGTVVITIPK